MKRTLEQTVQILLDSANREQEYIEESPSLEELANRLDVLLDLGFEWLPFSLPTFGGRVPFHLNGVKFNFSNNQNEFLDAWSDRDPFAVMSWSDTHFLILKWNDLQLEIIERENSEVAQ